MPDRTKHRRDLLANQPRLHGVLKYSFNCVAKGLLHTVLSDAAERARDRVSLEVDADSPTQADGLYVSMGWATDYLTESWFRDVDAG